MAGIPHRRPVHSGTGASSGAPEPADGKRRLIRGEELIARISDDHEPQLPVVGEDIPGPAVPCHVGTARLLVTVDRRTKTVGCAVHRPCSDSDDSDNDVLYAEEHDREVRQVNLRNEWSVDSWTADDSCGEGCAQLDDFNWFLPADDRVGDLPAPESQVDVSDSESEVDDVEPDSAPMQITTTAVKLLCPPVVTQTGPMEGCDPASPRRLRQGCDVLTEDGTVTVDTRPVSIASDTDVVCGNHMMSECIPTVTPKLAAAPQAASEVAQTRPRGYCCMNLLPPVGESIESLDVDAPDALASGKETAGGSSKVGSDICVVPDLLQTAVSVRTVVTEKWMERFILDLDDLCSDVLASGEEPAGGSSEVGSDVCVVPDLLPTAVSVKTVVAEKWMEWFVLDLEECPFVSRTSAARTFGPAVSEEYSPVVLAGGWLHSCSSGRNPGGWICRGGASPGTDRAFGSGKAPGW